MSLLEVTIAVALLGLVAATAITTLTILNKNASATRMMTGAKEVVQRNIESAIGTPFTSDEVPPILEITDPANPPLWDDDGGGDNRATIYANREATSNITGTLYRIVSQEGNAAGANLRRVTFRLSYSVSGRPQSYEMTTIRAVDR